MIQNVLYILARQLRILQRHVSLEHTRRLHMVENEIRVTEIKVHSKRPKDTSPDTSTSKRGDGSPEKKGVKEGRAAQGGPGDKEGQGSKGSPSDQGGKLTPVGKKSKGGQESKGSPSDHDSKLIPGDKGSKRGQESKGGQGTQGSPEHKEDKGSPDTSGIKGSSKAKGKQAYSQDHEEREDQRAKGQQGSSDSKKKQPGRIDEVGEDKSSTKSSKEKTTDPSAKNDITTLKAATGKSQGKTDRKRGKKGDDDDDDVLQEKLLVVSRTSSSDGGIGTVATLDQFRDMVTQIRELQAQFGLEDTLDDEALRSILYRETSLSHPIAAVNMSSRLKAAEKKLAAIMPIVTELAEKTPGIEMDAPYNDIFLRPLKTSSSKAGEDGIDEDDQAVSTAKGTPLTSLKQESDEESLEMDAPDAQFALLDPSIKGVTHVEMNDGLEEIYDAVMKIITESSKSQSNLSEGAMKRTRQVDARLDKALKVSDMFTKLDTSVEEYTEKINDLDGRLTTQMTSYQDELMQMQHSLESGLDYMAEVLAAPTEDAAAIAELNGYFTCFQFDMERTLERQDDLKTLQIEYSTNLDGLKQRVKELQEKKSARDEVADALSDKAGIAALNGLVSMEQYLAVRGDFEKRIGLAYDKFNNKEITWQKAIDDLVRELNEKTDLNQLLYLNEEIHKHLTIKRKYLDDMSALVGDIDPIMTKRKVERDGNCLSCGTPFNIQTDQDFCETRPPVIGAETAPAKEDVTKEYEKCYPGYPLTHPIDPRALVCHHYCGATGPTERESAFKMQISELNPKHGTKVGNDAKVHSTGKHKNPCELCNVPRLALDSPPDSIRFNVLVSDPIETLSKDETGVHKKGIMK